MHAIRRHLLFSTSFDMMPKWSTNQQTDDKRYLSIYHVNAEVLVERLKDEQIVFTEDSNN